MPELAALETAAATTPLVSELPSRFMLDGATGAETDTAFAPAFEALDANAT
jgi:hypothetical protein